MPDILNDMFVKNLKPESSEYTRREKGGFGVRVMPTGRKVFFYLYRIDGKRRFLNLGSYKTKENPDGITLAKAREEYEAERAKVKALKAGRSEGADPLEERREKKAQREEKSKADTVADLVDEYLKKHAKQFKKSWEADERLLNKEIIPIWGKRKAEDITKRDVTLLLESIIERGSPGMSNQVLKITRKMFNFAVERDLLQHTPFAAVKALAPNNSRERTLSESEIKTLWESVNNAAMSDEIRRALKLVLVTAQRPGEVAGMHTSEIDGKWWTIPAERSKNGKEHRVYLTATAFELIGNTKGKTFIFPCPHEAKKQPIDSHALPVAVRRNLVWPLTDKKGKPLYGEDGKPATENKLEIEKFTPHDLRRTAATFMAGMGFMDEVIDAVLNHVKKGIIRTYNRHGYDKEKQQALEAWDRKLKSIITGEACKVVTFNSRMKKA
ncbi:MAG: site-specific integrase [Deltaproteobacteria bacterium]|nr:site-specific integrase [Deltaproteobacteria bacterium]TLN01412.1 MAG: DUF4102 domain-containing protein [bacterium]